MDIGTYVGELLYEHETVAIPGFGSFVSSYQPAEVDQVQGELHPPSNTISFNENLVADDGLLVSYIHRRHGLSVNQAKEAVRKYVEQVKGAIQRQEIVVFPEVGRLYQDYEKNLQFLPDNTNFSTASYGLPMVNAYPVAWSHKPRQSAVERSAPAPNPKQQRAANLGLLAAIAAAVVVIAIAGYFLFTDFQSEPEEGLQRVPTSRVNVSPSGGEGKAADSLSVAESDTAAEPGEEILPPSEPFDTESPTAAPDRRYLVIVIGVFGNQKNVERLVDQIYDAGYEPYTERAGALTKVGIQKTYTEPEEVEEMLNAVRDEFTVDAKIYKR